MHSGNLEVILVLLLAAVVVVAFFKRLNLSPVLGYLVAGTAIGPHGLNIIKDTESTTYIAEFGVVFLLFYIGLELTLERLSSMKKHVLGFGSLQILLSGLAIGYVAYLLGSPISAAVIIGGGIALSSTAIVLQVLMERGEQSTQVGRLSLAVLIAQDLAVVPLLVIVPLLAQDSGNLAPTIADAVFKAFLATAIIIAFGRIFLRPLFRLMGSLKSRELFAATTLLIVLGAAFATEHFGLSLALGAFMAGLMVAETEYVHQVEADILPFKSLLLGLFFMSVGMHIDIALFTENLALIIILALAIMAIKAVLVISLCRLFGFLPGASVNAGLLLCQGGEFAFILFGLAIAHGVMDDHTSQILLVTITLTMAVTPMLATLGKSIANRMDHNAPVTFFGDIEKETKDLDRHIVVIGFEKVGRTICKLLSAKKINYMVLDSDAKNVHVGRRKGFPIYYGSPDREEVLEAVGMKRAVSVIVTIPDREEAVKTVRRIHEMYPNTPIIARGWDRSHVKALEEAGANVAIAEAFEVSMQMGVTILRAVGVADLEIERIIQSFRNEGYDMQLGENAIANVEPSGNSSTS